MPAFLLSLMMYWDQTVKADEVDWVSSFSVQLVDKLFHPISNVII